MPEATQQITVRWVYDPALEPDLFQDVLKRRAFAYLFDLIGVSLLWLVAAVILFFLGLATFGLAWMIYPALWPLLGVIYTVSSLAGPDAATPGMKAMGLAMRTTDGPRPDGLKALIHVVVFYALTVTLSPLIHLVALFTTRRQTIQDLVAGVLVMDGRVLAVTGR